MALEDRHEYREETGDERHGDDHRAPMHPQAATDQDHRERDEQRDVERGHRVVGGAVAQERERRDEQRVERRMKVRQHDERIRRTLRDRDLVLLLREDVVHARRALLDEDLGGCVEREEVRTLQVAADEHEPVGRPCEKTTDSGTGGSGEREAPPAAGRPALHRPVSRRAANRSGSCASRIACCAPPMS